MNRSNTHTVLIIDDSAAARATMSSQLKQAGYHVVTLPSAIGATRVILQHQIRVLVLDLSMPGLSGEKLISLLQANEKLTFLRIIVVSGRSDDELDRIRRQCQVHSVLSKRDIPRRLTGLVGACFQSAAKSELLG